MGTGQLDSAGPIQTRDGSNNPAPAQQTWHVTAAALLNYLFGCTRPSWWLVNSKLQHAGSSSLTRVQTQAPCVGSTESWPLNHWGSHTILLFRMSVQSGFHVTSSCLHCACRHTAADSVPLAGVQRASSSVIFGEQEFGSLFLRDVESCLLLCLSLLPGGHKADVSRGVQGGRLLGVSLALLVACLGLGRKDEKMDGQTVLE